MDDSHEARAIIHAGPATPRVFRLFAYKGLVLFPNWIGKRSRLHEIRPSDIVNWDQGNNAPAPILTSGGIAANIPAYRK